MSWKRRNPDNIKADMKRAQKRIAVLKQRLTGLSGDDQRITEQKLQKSQELLAMFSEAATDGFLVFDSALNVFDINQVAASHLGLTPVEATGRNLKAIFTDFEASGRYAQCVEVLHSDEPVQFDIVIPQVEQKQLYLSLKVFRVRDGLGIISTDVTERFHSEQKLRQQKDGLASANQQLRKAHTQAKELRDLAEKSNQAKSQFLANISHELRTPLNSILILSRMMKNSEDQIPGDKMTEYAETIHSSGSLLLELINDLLDLSKIEAGMMEFNVEEVLWEVVVKDVKRTFQPQVDERGLELVVEVAPDVPAEFHSDLQRLAQILNNLLSNAIKFTEQGVVKLRVFRPGEIDEVSRLGLAAGDALGVAVTDSGIGIAEEALDKIFDNFYQVDGTNTRSFGGTGLGLAISRQLARQFGGDLCVQSTVGRGSTFTLFIPVHATPVNDGAQDCCVEAGCQHTPGPEVGQALPTSVEEVVAGLSNAGADTSLSSIPSRAEALVTLDVLADKRILLIEDDMRSVFALMAALQPTGVDLIVAANGQEGLDKLHQDTEIDLVLLDMAVPVLDGYQLLQRLRQESGLAGLPVVSVTAKVVSGERQKCLTAGADDYLPKPIDIRLLCETILHWLKEKPRKEIST